MDVFNQLETNTEYTLVMQFSWKPKFKIKISQ